MNRSKYRSDRELFVWRQYGALQSQGMTHADIIGKLRETLGEAYALEVDSLDTLISASGPSGLAAAHRHATITAAAQLGCDLPRTLTQLEALTRRAVSDSAVWWRGFLSFSLYALTLLTVAAIVVWVFSRMVLPGFAHFFAAVFASEGISGTGITRDVLEHKALFLQAPIYLGLALLILVFTLFYRLRRHWCRQTGLDRVWKWLLPGSGIWQSFNAALAVNHARIFIDAGAPPDTATNAAFALFRMPWPNQPVGSGKHPHARSVQEFLALSQDLGTLDTEVSIQAAKLWAALDDRIFLTRDRVTLLLRIVLYILIGMIVVFLYQPVLHLGGAF